MKHTATYENFWKDVADTPPNCFLIIRDKTFHSVDTQYTLDGLKDKKQF